MVVVMKLSELIGNGSGVIPLNFWIKLQVQNHDRRVKNPVRNGDAPSGECW